MNYYSQYNQDKIINHLLRKKNGVFLDIGANDGITISNTFYFEKNLSWTGLCIEPIEEVFNILSKNRACVCLNCGIWSRSTTLEFYRAKGYSEMLSGIVDSFNYEHLNRLKNEVQKYGGELEIIEIKVEVINSILEKLGLYDVDFCSIDTEGSEFEILNSLDFDRFKIKLFVIENQYNVEKIRTLLQKKSYKFFKRVGGDDFFIQEKYYAEFSFKYRLFTYNLLENYFHIIKSLSDKFKRAFSF